MRFDPIVDLDRVTAQLFNKTLQLSLEQSVPIELKYQKNGVLERAIGIVYSVCELDRVVLLQNEDDEITKIDADHITCVEEI